MTNEGEIVANLEFAYNFAGKNYTLKKANLKQVMDFQRKTMEIQKENDPAADLLITAYALYLSLHAVDSTITLQYIEENAPGDIDPMETFILLGFMSRQKLENLLKIKNQPVNQ